MSIQEIITEALETRKFQPGQVKFSKSDWNDPHIQKILAAVATAAGVPAATIVAEVNNKLAQFAPMVQKAPILYKTIKDNMIEGELFNKLAEDLPNPIESGAPTFKERTFFKLVRSIAAEHDEFWPLRSYIDGRRLQPKFEFVTIPMSGEGVTTAAATPNGEFIFNTIFMQKLLDYAALKEIAPKGKKYVSNGGDIPDGYAYIEFLILHEFMHYTNDDFHYQKVIPNADNKIINWVGDFRSNYLLVKSGYEQLPIGLFNDDINYDRQKTYVEMYDLVKKEMEAMRDPEMEELMKKIQETLDKMGDDHEPGQEQGKSQPAKPGQGEEGEGSGPGGEMTPEDIDKAGKATEGKMEEGEDLSPEERAKKEGKAGKPGDGAAGSPGKGGQNGAGELDYSRIKPTFNWKGILNRLISKAVVRSEESYSKPSRRSVSSMDIARQVGAAAIKPAEKPEDFAELKIAFVIDSSGSMSNVIGKVMSNATNLLGTPKFKKAEAMVIKFSSTYDIFRVNFYANKATKVPDVTTVPKAYNLTSKDVFGVHFAAGTDFSSALAGDISSIASKKWNVLFFLDGDILSNSNFTNFMSVLKAHPANVFVIFDTVQTYQNFRRKAGMSTPNITYFQ